MIGAIIRWSVGNRFLVLLATRKLPEESRVTGAYKGLVYAVSAAAIVFGFIGGLDEIGVL